MIVYIEDVLLENFLITFLVLSVVYMLSGQKGSKVRHIFSSIFGALIALVYPLIYMSNILLILLKCGVGFIICLIAYREKTKKQLLFYTLFMLVTAVYGGVNLMISFCVYGSFDQGKLPTIHPSAILMHSPASFVKVIPTEGCVPITLRFLPVSVKHLPAVATKSVRPVA